MNPNSEVSLELATVSTLTLGNVLPPEDPTHLVVGKPFVFGANLTPPEIEGYTVTQADRSFTEATDTEGRRHFVEELETAWCLHRLDAAKDSVVGAIAPITGETVLVPKRITRPELLLIKKEFGRDIYQIEGQRMTGAVLKALSGDSVPITVTIERDTEGVVFCRFHDIERLQEIEMAAAAVLHNPDVANRTALANCFSYGSPVEPVDMLENREPERMTYGIDVVKRERLRQINEENHTTDGDTIYTEGQLLMAAIAYIGAVLKSAIIVPLSWWPWKPAAFKPDSRPLVKAAALLIAEIDRQYAAGEIRSANPPALEKPADEPAKTVDATAGEPA